MNSIIRLTAAVNKVNCANPGDCLEEMLQVLREFPRCDESDIVVFPKLSLCSPSCGSLFRNAGLLEQCADALAELAAATARMEGYIVAGLAWEEMGRPVSVMAVLHRGEVAGMVPTLDDPSPLYPGDDLPSLLPPDTVFACGDLRFQILGCDPGRLLGHAADAGCDLILVPCYVPMPAGRRLEICESARLLSRSAGCAVAVVNGGVGDTSFPHIYRGFCAVYECGAELACQTASYESIACTVDLDLDILRAGERQSVCPAPRHAIRPIPSKPGLLRPVAPDPFLPAENRADYLGELFSLQVRSLVERMGNIGASRLVVGVSGGLDSTSCLLVSAAAMDALGLPRGNVVGITMPGFGTSDRTHFNALNLMELLGVSTREIPIREAVQQHFEDIGHAGRQDTVYENAQARERTQILLDVANAVGGVVVGSGDLSEEALGFCTFGGDHLAGYNVNVCIAKTVLRELVRYVGESGILQGVDEVIADILDTPVSPELLPPDESGEIGQKTEEILGPYELHDFFLYYFIRCHFRPAKLYFYACVAFAGKLEPEFIKEKLGVFLKRFCAAQFKRSCAPDAADITGLSLLAHNFYIPSDLDPSALLRELQELGI